MAVKKKKAVVKKAAPNLRPSGWGLEGSQVTATNRHLFPETSFEVVAGTGGTKWARPRTELTGIDPALRGLVSGFDDTTKRGTEQIGRVYGALGAELQKQAGEATARMGGLSELAGKTLPTLFTSGQVAAPGSGAAVQAGAPTATAGVDQDRAATQQRMLLRDAASAVNTANLDAQQATATGAREQARYAGSRDQARSDLTKGLLLQTRADAAAARNAQLDYLGTQLSNDTKMKIEQAKLDQAASEEQGRNSRKAADIQLGLVKASGGSKAQAAADKKKAAYEKLRQSYMNEVLKGLSPYAGDTNPLTGLVDPSTKKPYTVPPLELFARGIARGLSARDAAAAIRTTEAGHAFLMPGVGNPQESSRALEILTQRYGAAVAQRVMQKVFGMTFAA